MRTSFIVAAALTALGAQADSSSTIVGFFAPNWDVTVPNYGGYTSTAASLAALDTKAATYHVGCVSDAPKTDCDYPSSWTIVQGPATVSVTAVYIASTSGKANYDLTVTESYECSLKSSTQSASCTMSVGITGSLNGAKYSSSTSTSATYTTAPMSELYDQLTVTAGLSSLTATATKTGGAVAATGIAGSMITAAPVVAAAAVAALL